MPRESECTCIEKDNNCINLDKQRQLFPRGVYCLFKTVSIIFNKCVLFMHSTRIFTGIEVAVLFSYHNSFIHYYNVDNIPIPHLSHFLHVLSKEKEKFPWKGFISSP